MFLCIKATQTIIFVKNERKREKFFFFRKFNSFFSDISTNLHINHTFGRISFTQKFNVISYPSSTITHFSYYAKKYNASLTSELFIIANLQFNQNDIFPPSANCLEKKINKIKISHTLRDLITLTSCRVFSKSITCICFYKCLPSLIKFDIN